MAKSDNLGDITKESDVTRNVTLAMSAVRDFCKRTGLETSQVFTMLGWTGTSGRGAVLESLDGPRGKRGDRGGLGLGFPQTSAELQQNLARVLIHMQRSADLKLNLTQEQQNKVYALAYPGVKKQEEPGTVPSAVAKKDETTKERISRLITSMPSDNPEFGIPTRVPGSHKVREAPSIRLAQSQKPKSNNSPPEPALASKAGGLETRIRPIAVVRDETTGGPKTGPGELEDLGGRKAEKPTVAVLRLQREDRKIDISYSFFKSDQLDAAGNPIMIACPNGVTNVGEIGHTSFREADMGPAEFYENAVKSGEIGSSRDVSIGGTTFRIFVPNLPKSAQGGKTEMVAVFDINDPKVRDSFGKAFGRSKHTF